ncbi:MAG TPA: extracellular solute-binding protein [Gaiellaceae bacterium]|nr:extracellular solute-binding protein [Gaiellaceae bacterium]
MRRAFAVSAALLSLALLTLVVVASGAQARSEHAQATTITLSGWSAGKVEDDLLQTMVNDFNKTHPAIHVDYSVINGDYATAMTARFAARNAPDVFYVDSSVAPTWVKQGVLQPLNSYIKASKFDTSKFYPGLLNAFKFGKSIYGFPKDWSPLATEINVKMFRQAGIRTAPRTWAQLAADAKKLAASGVLPAGAKPICLPPDWARMLAFIYQNKGSLANVQSPAVAAAVNFYVGLVKQGLAATQQQLGVGWPGEALGKEKAAIVFEGNWLLPYMHDTFPQVLMGVSPMVKGKVNGNLGFTVSYSMAKDSKNKAAAWTLLSWLTGKVGMTKWMSLGLALPSRTDVKAIGGRKAFLAAGPFSHGWGFPNFTATYTIMSNDLQAVMNGSMTTAQMLSDVAKSLKG